MSPGRFLKKSGGFPEDAPYGEDHLFVLQAARHGARPNRIGVAVGTSARRYITPRLGENNLAVSATVV